VSKEGFLQKRDFDGFQVQARICARDHPRYIPSTPSNLSLHKNPINSASNQESRNSSKEPNFHEQKRERGKRDEIQICSHKNTIKSTRLDSRTSPNHEELIYTKDTRFVCSSHTKPMRKGRGRKKKWAAPRAPMKIYS